jgi:hypothetical protein
MWCYGCDSKKERLLSYDSIPKQTLSLLRHDVCRVTSLITSWFFTFELEGTVEVVVCERIEKKVLVNVLVYLFNSEEKDKTLRNLSY